MIELFKPFSSSARDARHKIREESRRHLETELGKPMERMAHTIWQAFDEFASHAWRYSTKVFVVGVAAILTLTLLLAGNAVGDAYISSDLDLFLYGAMFIAIGTGVALWLLSNKFYEFRHMILRLKLPSLYRLDERLAEDVSRDAVLSAIKDEYARQMRHADDFVSEVREARLQRESARTALAASRASGWVNIVSVEDAERLLRVRLFMASATESRGTAKWCAVRVDSGHIDTGGTWGSPWFATYGACYALFLEAPCHGCGIRLRCGEPYQLRHSPVGKLFGPSALTDDIPPLGKYKSWWVPEAPGTDTFEGGWFCATCFDAPK